MEKNSNFDTLIKSFINAPFHRNENWCGYFELGSSTSMINYSMVKKTIEYFYSYFNKNLNDFIVVSSLFIDNSRKIDDSKILKNVLKAEQNLVNKGYIRLENINFSKENHTKKIKKLESLFKVLKPNKSTFKHCSLVLMCDSHLYPFDAHGYCFFISLKHNIAIYPHCDEYPGYGCFSIDKNKKCCINFLKKAEENNIFDVYYSKNISIT